MKTLKIVTKELFGLFVDDGSLAFAMSGLLGLIALLMAATVGIDPADAVREKLAHTFNAIEWSRRKPTKDQEFGYESEHLICTIPPHIWPPGWDTQTDLPRTVEIQLRTIMMHAYAEPQHDIAYKASTDLPPDIRRELAWIAASTWGADRAYQRIMEWSAKQNSSE